MITMYLYYFNNAKSNLVRVLNIIYYRTQLIVIHKINTNENIFGIRKISKISF